MRLFCRLRPLFRMLPLCPALFCLALPPLAFAPAKAAQAAGRVAPLGSYHEILGVAPPPESRAGGARRAARARMRAKLKDELGLSESEQPAASARLPDEDGARRSTAGRGGKAAFRGPPPALDPAWKRVIDRLAADGLEREKTEALFAALGPHSYSPAYMAAKITELYGVGGIGINRAEAAVPDPPEGYEQPLSDVTIGSCLNLMKKHAEALAAIEARHGVPPRVVVAVLLAETGLGLDLGDDAALRALGSMAAASAPDLLGRRGNARQAGRVRPAALAATLREKSDWAYNEVKALIRYADRVGADAARIPGSIYGAIGICQFMPSSIELYGEDVDKDGKVDVFSLPDAMGSVGKYLEANGWREAGSSARQFAVIKSYNQDNFYAARVLGTANHLGRAIAGKVPAGRSALAGPVPASALDPSLRRVRRGGPGIRSLGSYKGLLE